MSFNLDNLFIEWRRIVPTGVPNPKNAYHLTLLKEICLSKGISTEVVDSVMLVLEKEETFKARNIKSGEVVVFKSEKNRDKGIEDGRYEKVEKEDDDSQKVKAEPMKISANPMDKSKDDDEARSDETKPEYSFRSKADATEGLFTTAEEGYKTITTESGKKFKVRQLKDPRTGKVLDTINQEDRETAIAVVSGRLDELKDKSKAAVDLLKTEKDKVKRTLALKWLGEYGEMQAYVDFLQRGEITDVHLLTDSEVKNDILVVMENDDRTIDAYGVSVKTTKEGEMANQRGASAKGDFIDRINATKNPLISKGGRNYKLGENVTQPVNSGVLINSMLEIRKQFIKLHSAGKTGVSGSDTFITLDGKKLNVAEFLRTQKITSEDVSKIFNDEEIFARLTKKKKFRKSGNPIRGLADEEVDENQYNQLREHFRERITKWVESADDGEGISISQMEEFIKDDMADIMGDIGANLVPSADLMISYYKPDGSFSNGFMTKERQLQKMEEQLGPVSDMSKRDQITKILGLDFTGRGAGKKKEGTGHIDGQSYGRPNPKIQPKPSKVDDYIKEISS